MAETTAPKTNPLSDLKFIQRETTRRLKSFLFHQRDAFAENISFLLYPLVSDSVILGFRKQFVYEAMAINEKAKTSCDYFTAKDVADFKVEAARQMRKRFDRDFKTTMELLRADREKEMKCTSSKPSGNERMDAKKQRKDMNDIELIRKEFCKLLFSLAGIYFPRDYLLIMKETEKSPTSSPKSLHDDSDDDREEDEDAVETMDSFPSSLQIWSRVVLLELITVFTTLSCVCTPTLLPAILN